MSSDDALPSPNAPLAGEESDEKLPRCPRCPHCDARALRLVGETSQPSWSVLLDHLDPRCPDWYAELDFQEHCRYLMERTAWIMRTGTWKRGLKVQRARRLLG